MAYCCSYLHKRIILRTAREKPSSDLGLTNPRYSEAEIILKNTLNNISSLKVVYLKNSIVAGAEPIEYCTDVFCRTH